MKRILIAGFYGFGNTGDEAILAAMLDDLRSRIPEADFVVVSADPESTAKMHHVAAVSWALPADILKAAETSDLLIVGGGGLFHDYWGVSLDDILLPEHIRGTMQSGYAGVATLATLLHKPLMLYAVGVGPLLTPEGEELTRTVANMAQVITVRDEPSRQLLVDLGVAAERITVTADPAFRLRFEARYGRKYWQQVVHDATQHRLIINLRPWHQEAAMEQFLREFALALTTIHSILKPQFLFVPFHQQDVAVGEQLQQLLPEGVAMHIIPSVPHPRVVAGLFTQAEMAIGMRYHSLIFAAKSRLPVLGISYDPKVAHLMTQLGLDPYLLGLQTTYHQDILDVFRSLWEQRGNLPFLADRVVSLEGAALENARIAAQLLDSFSPSGLEGDEAFLRHFGYKQTKALLYSNMEFRTTVEKMRHELDEMKAENASLNAERAYLSAQLASALHELNAIKQSRGWKVVERLWHIRIRLIPPKSRRARILRRGFHLVAAFRRTLRDTISTIRRHALLYLRRYIPSRLKQAYVTLVRDQAVVDRHEVILFADGSVLPEYEPRYDVSDISTLEDVVYPPVSLISTMLNEENNAREWMASLLQQTHMPDEVVLVDGGSSDNTVAIVREMAERAPFQVRIIETPGTTIAQGRNIAIREATHEIVACTDFGCTLDRDWLRYLILPFAVDPDIQVVSGFYKAAVTQNRERILARFFVPDVHQVDPQAFLPSGRSVAMKKRIWAQVGGYPEWLSDAGEDTLFDILIRSIPARWAFVPAAVVHWSPPKTLKQMWRTVFRYAKGDGETGLLSSLYVSKMRKLARYALFMAMLIFMALVLGNTWGVMGLGVMILTWVIVVAWALWLDFRGSEVKAFAPLYKAVATGVLLVAQVSGFIAGVLNRAHVKERQRQLYEDQLREIVQKHSDRKGIVVYPPTHDWHFMFQRPQQMMRAFARAEYLVFYMTNNERTDAVVGFQEQEPGLYLTHVPLETFSTLESFILYIGSPWHSKVPDMLPQATVIYDHYDDLDVSSARLADHEALLARSDLVVTTSKRLLARVQKKRPDVVYAPNGVDYAFIRSRKPQSMEDIPPDLQAIVRQARPIIGYSGALAEWFDYDLMRQVAMGRPDLSFVLIGVDYDGSLTRSGILDLENVYWLGLKPYDRLFDYVWWFDVATIPFKVNEITLATSPIKLFEYMACEKPVVTTPLPECLSVPGVLIGADANSFNEQIDKALGLGDDADFRALLRRTAAEQTWDMRAQEIIGALERLA